MYQCEVCDKVFEKSTSLRSHKRVHTSYKPKPTILCCSLLTGEVVDIHQLNNHEASNIKKRKQCLSCGKIHFKPKFCSSSCAAQYSNKGKTRSSKKTKVGNCCICGTGMTMNIRASSSFSKCSSCKHNAKEIQNISGPYTKIFLNTCYKTNQPFFAPTYKKYHPKLKSPRDKYVDKCKFNFALTDYPEWFDLNLIKMYGMYSTPGSRSGVRNLNGVSRDHLLSINDGWNQNVPPEMLSHPANCCLVRHRDNQSKNSKSVITYNELILMIEEFKLTYLNV